MPLSEHEQRLLEQIEQALYAEDPKFASIYRETTSAATTAVGSSGRHRVRHRIGPAAGRGGHPLVPLGVAGFVVMLAAASFGVASWQRMTGHRTPRPSGRGPCRGSSAPARWSGGSKRRWQRRQDTAGEAIPPGRPQQTAAVTGRSFEHRPKGPRV